MSESPNAKFLYEILVPTVRSDGRPIRLRFHRVWDKEVCKVSGGLTVLTSGSKGAWISPDKTLFEERMLPVRFMATYEEACKIVDFTLKYYQQECVMCYRISDQVILRHATKKHGS